MIGITLLGDAVERIAVGFPLLLGAGLVFGFGKYKGRSVEEVFRMEPSYYAWMMNGDFPLYTKKVITEIRMREKLK